LGYEGIALLLSLGRKEFFLHILSFHFVRTRTENLSLMCQLFLFSVLQLHVWRSLLLMVCLVVVGVVCIFQLFLAWLV